MTTHYKDHHVHTITREDVGKPWIRINGRVRPVSDFLGRVLVQDVGKWVLEGNGVLSVENDEQRDAREKRSS